ncbi:MAG TPA: dUTP diphosphatase [Acholeplasmataceae bacterium]|jgi:dUTP pyrophosphatase|nr:dUTP diphosphatase [Acholeplasmataceae bacterium]
MGRGFEKINELGIIPKRSTSGSAGYDFYLPENITINPNEIKVVDTYIKAYMENDEFLAIFIRSSMGIKKGLRVVNSVGIIDSDYYNNPENGGHIKIALKNESSETINLEAGERIAQGIFLKYLTVDNDAATNIRQGGIGSTDKK